MSIFKLPDWLDQHLFTGKDFKDIGESELEELRSRLSKFNHENPEVSIVIPAWNEENNIYRTLSSLASNITDKNVELLVINNNSTDNTQKVLDRLGVRSYFQPIQGISFARQMGLLKARGSYHLCADSDTFYPPKWIELMTNPMVNPKTLIYSLLYFLILIIIPVSFSYNQKYNLFSFSGGIKE